MYFVLCLWYVCLSICIISILCVCHFCVQVLCVLYLFYFCLLYLCMYCMCMYILYICLYLLYLQLYILCIVSAVSVCTYMYCACWVYGSSMSMNSVCISVCNVSAVFMFVPICIMCALWFVCVSICSKSSVFVCAYMYCVLCVSVCIESVVYLGVCICVFVCMCRQNPSFILCIAQSLGEGTAGWDLLEPIILRHVAYFQLLQSLRVCFLSPEESLKCFSKTCIITI